MHIYVDADACPVKESIVRVAQTLCLPVTMITDTAHNIHDGYSRVITVDKGADSVDFKLISLLSPGDIAVTQDYALAAMVLAKNAVPVNQNGFAYTKENIDRLLFERHLAKQLRKAGKRTKGPKKRNKNSDLQFEQFFLNLLQTMLNNKQH